MTGEPTFAGTLVSRDGRVTAIIVDAPVDVSYPELVGRIEAIVDAERDASTTIALAGAPVVAAAIQRYTAQMGFLFAIAVAVIALVHYEAFRTLQAMALPLVTALLSVTSALGAMAAGGSPIDTWSAATPVAILAVAAGHAVQVLKRYYEEYAQSGDTRAAVVASLTKVGPVMAVASLIAAGGFASLASSAAVNVRVFGLLMAFGIVSAFILEMTFIPACRVLLPPPGRDATRRERESRWVSAGLALLVKPVLARPRVVAASGAILVVLAALVGGRVRADSSLRALLPSDSTVLKDDALLNANLGGTSTVKLLLEGARDGVLEDPEVLQAVDDLQTFIGGFPEVGKTISIVDYVKRMHRAMDGGDGLPSRRALVAQYLLLYSFGGADELSSMVDAGYRNGAMLVLSKSDAAGFADRFVTEVRRFATERFRGLPLTVGLAGGSVGAQAAMNDVITHEKVRNIVQVTLIILALSALAFRSLVAAFLVVMPLVVTGAVAVCAMALTHTWFNMSTAAVIAMGISIGADFAVYVLYRLHDEVAGRTLEEAVERTLLTSGKAVFFVASAVTLGYLVLIGSGFVPWMHLGGLTALMIASSALGSLTVLPAVVVLVRPRVLMAPAPAAGERGRAAMEVA